MLEKIINDNLIIEYAPNRQSRVDTIGNALDRLLCTVTGFTTETYNLDFAFSIPLNRKENLDLSFYKDGTSIYMGVIKYGKKNTVQTVLNVDDFNMFTTTTVNRIIKLLHENEKRAIQKRSFNKIMDNPTVRSAWQQYLQKNKVIPPVLREYVNPNTREMSTRNYYELTVNQTTLDFSCWILDKNPTMEKILEKLETIAPKAAEYIRVKQNSKIDLER